MSIEQHLPTQAFELADKARRFWWEKRNTRVFGASVALQDEAEKLLVLKRRYGDTSLLVLPGGGLPIKDQINERRNPFVGQPQEYERYERTAWKELHEEAGIKRSLVEERGLLTESYDEQGEGRDLQVIYHGLVRATFMPLSLNLPSNEIDTRTFMKLKDIDLSKSHHALAAAVIELQRQATQPAINN